jgi:hypothetical protein
MKSAVETHAAKLVKRLRAENRKAERRGAEPLPDGEYAALERELAHKLARHSR